MPGAKDTAMNVTTIATASGPYTPVGRPALTAGYWVSGLSQKAQCRGSRSSQDSIRTRAAPPDLGTVREGQ